MNPVLNNYEKLLTRHVRQLISVLDFKLSDKVTFPTADQELEVFLDSIESFVGDEKLKAILQLKNY